MPVPGFLASFADKAQSAINASPLAGHIPTGSHGNRPSRPSSPDAAPQPSANEAAGQGGAKSHTLEALSYQFRALQQQYSTTTPVQKIITIEKGVAMDFDNVSRDSKAQSKELYTWGQNEADDLKDVTDRLAYLNFVQGSLAASLSTKLESARVPIKALRDAETNLQPRKNIRLGIQSQIAKIEHDQNKANEARSQTLRDQLRKAESDDLPLEKEVDLLKRKAVRESEQIKWDAIREYGEKLVLLAQAASPIIAVLPAVPPTAQTPYEGHGTTGAVRASLQRALDNYKTGHINLPQGNAADLSRSDTRSFGESHASELSSIHSETSGTHVGVSPPTSSSGRPGPPHSVGPVPIGAHGSSNAPGSHTTPQATTHPLPSFSTQGSSPINPSALNQAPAPIPHPVYTGSGLGGATSPTLASTAPSLPVPSTVSPITTDHAPSSASNAIPAATPTIAETGMPVSAGPGGPGPASGSLHDIHAASPDAGPRTGGLPGNSAVPEYGSGPGSTFSAAATGLAAGSALHPKHESAEEEKRRLQAMYSQPPSDQGATSPVGAGSAAPPPHHETAEEEKRRLAAMYSQQPPPIGASSAGANSSAAAPPHHETAEEEKKRLEREEREKLLHSGGPPQGQGKPEDDLPPYQEPGFQ
ncbi:Eisosome component PIL1-domain-containing protein [Crepidotus variabilis]|uniref:Eisosome component PIL1-domain-containing protein n=1 Tax=Crepidotus variabilis TaxID=179855 RepID=A0A9P6ENE4_9AGAR|nr:Eisosome component PIL1-domain-containing protein [Crepidotus variabilis]